MDKNNEILINLKTYRIYWGIMLTLVVLFVSIIIFKVELGNESQLSELRKANEQAKIREKEANIKLEEAKTQLLLTNSKIHNLESEISNQTLLLIKMESNYSKAFNDLIKLQDEKYFIPSDVSLDEQFKFITNYKYSEYKPIK